ncbi:MAG: membrane protein insertase YidC, partial [Thiogranum sp.]
MDNPRVLLAIALSFLVLLIWQAWMEDYGPQPKPAEQATVVESPVVDDSGEDLPVAPDDQPPASAEEDVPAQLPAGQRVEIATDMFRAVIDTRGGDLREVDLLHYRQSPEEGSEAFRLMEESANQLFIAQSGLRATKGPEPTHHAVFQVDQNRFELADDADVLEVPLRWSNDAGVEVTKLYRFQRGSYVVEVEHQIRNQGDTDWSARPYHQLQRTPLQQQSRFLYTYTGGVLYSP